MLSSLQFKSTAIAVATRNFGRLVSSEATVGPAQYIAALAVGTTVMGIAAEQAYALSSGKSLLNVDPFSEHGMTNIGRGFLRGGALGFVGDFLTQSTNGHGQNFVTSALGPGVQLANTAADLTFGNAQRLAAGEETKFGSALGSTVKGLTPGANLWYTKMATDKLVFNEAMEWLSPGYQERRQKRLEETTGQSYIYQ